MTKDTKETDQISKLLADKKKFDAYVYTPLRDALRELKEREHDSMINTYLENVPKLDLPLNGKKCMILCRNVATPNYEMHRFLMCADVITELNAYVFEYTKDKYTHINKMKTALGRMRFYKGLNKLEQPIFQYKNIINMNESNGKMINVIETQWKQSLVEFHHTFLTGRFPFMKDNIIDISDWLHKAGTNAHKYYEHYLSFFLRDGFLFENFAFNADEYEFNRTVVLPTIFKIQKLTGKKPLIVALEPTDIEGSDFWESYPAHTIDFVVAKLNNLNKVNGEND